ncbi:Hvo_1808 family surface protein [Halorubrum trueperi]|uniref:Hvo_1808 family surface protein n=1 Tax=Halorubrum trueperi TaxID=2004704 RepID=A0ABD5UKV9_9EURY
MRRVHTLSFVVAAIVLLSIGGIGVVAGDPIDDGLDDPIDGDDLAPSAPASSTAVGGDVLVSSAAVSGDAPVSSAAAGGDAPASATADECGVEPDTELVGCWNGSHYEDDLSFNQSDGLTEAELESLTHLTMARVEHLRERPFREDVPVETVTRTEFMNGSTGSGNGTTGVAEDDEAFQRWNDEVWRALFVVGDDAAAGDEIDAVFGGAVTGFYSPGEDRIVLVVREGEEVQIDPSTLAHELVHAMQDQYHDLTHPRYVGATQDADLAVDGIVEGEAVHVEELYDARCANGWSCLAEPDDGGGSGGSAADYNFGILQTVLQPYSDGALYVEELVDEEGWSAVTEAMESPPDSTAEVIHRNPDYETREIEFEDSATDGWERYPDQGVDGAETTGEASMFVMFWYQSYEYDHLVLDPSASVRENVLIHTQPDEQLRTRANYNYAHDATAGWAGDELYPYRDGEEDGYVWVTEWQTPTDATEFREAYLEMLTAHGDGSYVNGEVYEIDGGDFSGAYGVDRDSTTVTIAHAPEPADVLELRPDADFDRPDSDGESGGDGGDGGDDTTRDGDDENGDANGGDGPADGDGPAAPGTGTPGEVPGFGVVAAIVALIAAVSVLARRSRP